MCKSGVFPLVIKACRDLADIEARIKFLREKFSNGGLPFMLAAMKKHSNTSSVTYIEPRVEPRIFTEQAIA